MNILVVDDEYLIRKGIRAILERSDLAITRIGEAENGRQAVDEMQCGAYDLAIMDIRMPELDGLSAIREALELDDPPAFIILSGHDEFDYARTAIRFGVSDYLLKPVDMRELVSSVQRVLEARRREKGGRRPEAAQGFWNAGSMEHEINFILLNMNLSDAELQEIARHAGGRFPDQPYRLLSMELVPDDLTSTGEQAAFRELLSTAGTLVGAWAAMVDFERHPLFLIASSVDTGAMQEHFDQCFGPGYCLGVSTAGTGLPDLRRCHREAVQARKHRLLLPGTRIVRQEDIPDPIRMPEVPIERIKALQALIGSRSPQELEPLLGQIFRPDGRTMTIPYLEQCAQAVNTYVLDYFGQLLPHSRETESEQDVRDMYRHATLDTYLESLSRHLHVLSGLVALLRAQYRENTRMDTVLQWIEAHHDNPNLSMGMVANQFSINYTYFSELFREQTGMSFVSHLKRLRIRKACGLLDTNRYRIGEVARMTGFTNPRLFSRSFREETGVTPAAYAAQHALDRK